MMVTNRQMRHPGFHYLLLGIETDPTCYHGERAHRPALLPRQEAAALLESIAARLLPAGSDCTLTMAGALFDRTQVLRPGYPVFTALRAARESVAEPPRLHAVVASDGVMPAPDLQPLGHIRPGVLQLLPILVGGPPEQRAALADTYSVAHGVRAKDAAGLLDELERGFRITPLDVRFMTVEALNQLVKGFMQHQGLTPVWALLDAAINQPGQPLDVEVVPGGHFSLRDGEVHGAFQTFDLWASHGSGAELPSGQGLQAAYAEWTHGYRSCLGTLASHGIRVHQHLLGMEDAALEGSFLVEESTLVPDGSAARVTEHRAGRTGVVAVTVAAGNRQVNLYPLTAEGLDDLYGYIQEQGLGGDAAYPGCICYEQDSRRLCPGSLAQD